MLTGKQKGQWFTMNLLKNDTSAPGLSPNCSLPELDADLDFSPNGLGGIYIISIGIQVSKGSDNSETHWAASS